MKIKDLREKIKGADREKLEKIAIECYKQLSKTQKEQTDTFLLAIIEGGDQKEIKGKNKGPAVPFEALEQEIETFLENAYAQNYVAPNRVISKKNRPKWRFLVKGYIKSLVSIQDENENFDKSVVLLTKLYKMLCTACYYYLFSTDDAFRSIGMTQTEVFDILVARTFQKGFTKENLSSLLLLSTSGGLSRECLYVELEAVLVNHLKTTDLKEIAVQEALRLINETEGKISGLKKYDSNRYGYEHSIENLSEIILMIHVGLAELEKGLDLFFKLVKSKRKEEALYVALRLMYYYGDEKDWIFTYEYAIQKKITPNDNAKRRYKELTTKSTDDEALS